MYMGFIVFIYHIIRIRVAMVRRSSVPMRHGHSSSLSLCDTGFRDMPYQIRPLGHIQYIPSHWLVLPTIELPPPLFLRRETDAYAYISFHFYSYSIYITDTCLYSVALIVGEYSYQRPLPFLCFLRQALRP